MPTATRVNSRAAMVALTALAALSALAQSACSSEESSTLTVEIITGQEKEAFSQDPKVTRLDVVAKSPEGDINLKASAAPGGTFDLGETPESRLLFFDITGVDAQENVVVRGRSIGGILLSAVSDNVVPVFVQRLNQWARPPGGLLAAHTDGPAVPFGERYVVSTGGSASLEKGGEGDAKTSEFYDLFSYSGIAGPILPRAALSAAARSGAILVVDNEGASWINFQNGSSETVSRPSVLGSFADVAGGATIEASDGRTFIVGATRRSSPAVGVLVVQVDGSVDAINLPAPRAGAAAAWVEKVGLVIAGGSATEPGVIVLGSNASKFGSKAFPPDATEGAGGVVVDAEHITLIGGVVGDMPAPTRTLDLNCTAACEAAILPEASLPVGIVGVSAYALGGTKAIVVGSEAAGAGMNRTFVLDLGAVSSVVELPLREPRKGATPSPAPNGTLLLVGGVHQNGTPALSVEMFFPPE